MLHKQPSLMQSPPVLCGWAGMHHLGAVSASRLGLFMKRAAVSPCTVVERIWSFNGLVAGGRRCAARWGFPGVWTVPLAVAPLREIPRRFMPDGAFSPRARDGLESPSPGLLMPEEQKAPERVWRACLTRLRAGTMGPTAWGQGPGCGWLPLEPEETRLDVGPFRMGLWWGFTCKFSSVQNPGTPVPLLGFILRGHRGSHGLPDSMAFVPTVAVTAGPVVGAVISPVPRVT